MKKNKNRNRLLLAIAIAVLLLLILLGGNSFSKYITQVEGKGVIQVAKWAFIVNGQTTSMTNINLASTYDKETLVENSIAPGTRGSFDIIIDASGSDTGIEYNVKFQNEIGKPSNFKFIYDNHVVNSIKELEQYLIGCINLDDADKVKKITIKWEWKYETGADFNQIQQNDEEDTNDGEILENYSFDVIVTGIQVEPKE